ncbi:MAG: hypothetical protein AB7E12_14200, partial [Burkholderiaceae bacterium]
GARCFRLEVGHESVCHHVRRPVHTGQRVKLLNRLAHKKTDTPISTTDQISLAMYTSAAATTADNILSTNVSSALTVASTEGPSLLGNTVLFIRGTYDSADKTFSGTNLENDALLIYDSHPTADSVQHEAIVLIGAGQYSLTVSEDAVLSFGPPAG